MMAIYAKSEQSFFCWAVWDWVLGLKRNVCYAFYTNHSAKTAECWQRETEFAQRQRYSGSGLVRTNIILQLRLIQQVFAHHSVIHCVVDYHAVCSEWHWPEQMANICLNLLIVSSVSDPVYQSELMANLPDIFVGGTQNVNNWMRCAHNEHTRHTIHIPIEAKECPLPCWERFYENIFNSKFGW